VQVTQKYFEDLWLAVKFKAKTFHFASFGCKQIVEIMVVDCHGFVGTLEEVLVIQNNTVVHLPVFIPFAEISVELTVL
jgi:hypothetical protein